MSLIPPNYLKSVVSIEVEGKDSQGDMVMRPIATGFLLGRATGEKNPKGEGLYRTFLVTNRHVFEDKSGKRLNEVQLRHDIVDQAPQHFKVPLLDASGSPTWLSHSNPAVDIAVLPVIGSLKAANIDYSIMRDDQDVFLAKDFAAHGVATGDGVFVLGFPLGLRGTERNYAIVRHGIIARVDPEVLKEHFFYIDAAAYPGNSGGPVIHRPELVSITGTTTSPRAGLLGVISSGVTYTDVAVSQQSGEPRIVFTEQTGLVRVVPIESVYDVIDAYIAQYPLPAPAPSPTTS